MTEEAVKPTVLVVTSQVGRGAIGSRAAAFALERLGHPVFLVPTVWMPWHPGHGRSTRVVPEATAFAAALAEIADGPWAGDIGTVLTGWFADDAQIEAVRRLVERLRERTPSLRLVVDPVLGDRDAHGHGTLYVAEATARALRDRLLPLADVATPNLFETAWLSGRAVETTTDGVAAARTLAPKIVAVTSAPALMVRSISTLLVTPTTATQYEHPLLEPSLHGTGDLFAGLLTARLADGVDPETAAARAVAGVFEIVARSVRAGADELRLVDEQDRFVHPMAQVAVRRIGETPQRVRRAAVRPVALD